MVDAKSVTKEKKCSPFDMNLRRGNRCWKCSKCLDEIEMDKALDKVYDALHDLNTVGLRPHLAKAIRLTIDNELGSNKYFLP